MNGRRTISHPCGNPYVSGGRIWRLSALRSNLRLLLAANCLFCLHVVKACWLIIVILLNTLGAAQTNCTPGTWTISNQPPDSCLPFATNGIFTKQLPGAGSGGPMNHLYANSDAIISNTMTGTDMGIFRVAGPKNYHQDTLGEPIYYATARDPIYKITACYYNGPASSDIHNPVGHTFHIPNKALFSNNNPTTGAAYGDEFFVVWDQTSNFVLGVYAYKEYSSLANCTATTPAAACPTPSTWRSCAQSDFSTGVDYGIHPGATGALNAPGWALAIRTDEWMHGEINHALYLNTGCEAVGAVFPNASPSYTAAICSPNQTLRPHEGNLIFLDYTDAQINAMKLPAWQKPIIMALAHYGGYIGDTNNALKGGPINVSRVESGQAYQMAGLNNPLYAWLTGQLGVTKHGASDNSYTYEMATFGGIPNVTGPNCPSTPCGVISHMHIADPCVALGLAGLSGCAAPTALRRPPRRAFRQN